MVIKRISTMLGGKKGDNTSSSSSGGFLSRRRNDDVGSPSRATAEDYTASSGDSPEASAARGVRLFCESGGPNNQGEEVLHLPTIVEAAESSPSAAAAAAVQIRKFMTKDNYNRPHVIYNAIMLIRILADNPGPTFTRNIDTKFVSTTKDVLRSCKDPSVQQMLRETLNSLYAEKAYDVGLGELFKMWGKEQGVETGRLPPQRPPNTTRASSGQHSQLSQVNSRTRRTLPGPAELSARIEESRTSAKLLQQLIQSTAPNELLGNDLIKEFADRCQSAQRSMQDFLNCDNPPPDDDTMQTLIETSEQLSLASSRHSRAILQARRADNAGLAPTSFDPPTPASGISSLSNTQSQGVSSMGAHSPESNNTALPYGVTTGTYPPRVVSPSGPTSSTFVPVGIPPVTHAGYAPPPMPPASYIANKRLSGIQPEPIDPYAQGHPSRNSGYGMPVRGGPPGNRNSTYDNPFADDHAQEHHEEHDDLYNDSPMAARHRNNFNDVPAINTTSPTGTHYNNSTGSPTSATTPRQSQHRPNAMPQDSWRRPDRVGPDGSYAPGYHSTPSYLHRQESSGDNITMTGAMGGPPATHNPLGGNPVRREADQYPDHQRHSSNGSGRVSLIQEHEIDDDDREEEDPTTPVSQHSPGYLRQQQQREQQQYRGGAGDRTSAGGYPSPYRNTAPQGTIMPRTTPHQQQQPQSQTYTGASLPPSQRMSPTTTHYPDATTAPTRTRPPVPSQNTGYGAYTTTHPASNKPNYDHYEDETRNPYHDNHQDDDGELNMQGHSSLGVPNSYLSSAEGGGVHRSNTLSTIQSESEYAPSIRGEGRGARGGYGRGYDER